jgi:hypothetical protein
MASVRKSEFAAIASRTEIVVLGAQFVPADIADEGLLTPEDYAALALDHIERTSKVVFQLQIVKRA